MLSDPVLVITKISRALADLSVFHFVGGSLASSVYGIPRATQDADMVVQLTVDKVPALVSALEKEFYIEGAMALDAIQKRGSFNVIHLETLYKADLFIMQSDPWALEEARRCRTERLEPAAGSPEIRIASPEDTILHKLKWYKMGDCASDRQWGDIQGVLKVRGGDLDIEYLRRWSVPLEVADLLERALEEAGIADRP